MPERQQPKHWPGALRTTKLEVSVTGPRITLVGRLATSRRSAGAFTTRHGEGFVDPGLPRPPGGCAAQPAIRILLRPTHP